jgi:hypothetical protein
MPCQTTDGAEHAYSYVTDGLHESPVVEPVYPFQRRELLPRRSREEVESPLNKRFRIMVQRIRGSKIRHSASYKVIFSDFGRCGGPPPFSHPPGSPPHNYGQEQSLHSVTFHCGEIIKMEFNNVGPTNRCAFICSCTRIYFSGLRAGWRRRRRGGWGWRCRRS